MNLNITCFDENVSSCKSDAESDLFTNDSKSFQLISIDNAEFSFDIGNKEPDDNTESEHEV